MLNMHMASNPVARTFVSELDGEMGSRPVLLRSFNPN